LCVTSFFPRKLTKVRQINENAHGKVGIIYDLAVVRACWQNKALPPKIALVYFFKSRF
jgi:hypothetical protein